MIIVATVLIFLCGVFAIVYANRRIENKTARIVCLIGGFLMAILSAVFLLLTVYFAWAVSVN